MAFWSYVLRKCGYRQLKAHVSEACDRLVRNYQFAPSMPEFRPMSTGESWTREKPTSVRFYVAPVELVCGYSLRGCSHMSETVVLLFTLAISV